jgi:hypothetical protein
VHSTEGHSRTGHRPRGGHRPASRQVARWQRSDTGQPWTSTLPTGPLPSWQQAEPLGVGPKQAASREELRERTAGAVLGHHVRWSRRRAPSGEPPDSSSHVTEEGTSHALACVLGALVDCVSLGVVRHDCPQFNRLLHKVLPVAWARRLEAERALRPTLDNCKAVLTLPCTR